jgi:hypothetical protein
MLLKAKKSSRRPLHAGTCFLLLMLCLRALVPAGFMLAEVDGTVRVVLCDADAPGARGHHHHADHQNHHHTRLDASCPYAQSAGPAPLPVTPCLADIRVAVLQSLPQASSQLEAQFGPSREQQPRAPPLI